MESTLDQQLTQAILEGNSDLVMQENSERPCHGKAANTYRIAEWVAFIENVPRWQTTSRSGSWRPCCKSASTIQNNPAPAGQALGGPGP